MPQLIYIDLNDGRASTSLSTFSAPVLYGVQGSPVTYDFAFHDDGVIRALSLGDMPKLIMQLASATGGTTPRVIGSVGTASGSGTGSRYRCSLVADNAAVRADFAAEAASLVYELQLNWSESSDAATRRTQGITLNLDVARDLPNTETPNPVSELSDPDLYVSNRALCFDREQTLSNGEKQQALDNLGLNDSLSYRPGVIAVNSTQVPGVRTEPTLQAALDVMAASPTTYHTIDIIDDGGGTLTAAASAFSIAALHILGTGKTITALDLTAAQVGALYLGCNVGDLTAKPHGPGSDDFVVAAVGNVSVSTLTCLGISRNAGGTPVYNNLIFNGPIYVGNVIADGIPGSTTGGATLAQRHGCNGCNVIAQYGAVFASLSQAGGDGANGDVAVSSGNSGNGGLPGTYDFGPLCAVDYAGGALSVGGAAGTPAGGGTAGTSHTSDTSSGTIHPSSFLTP